MKMRLKRSKDVYPLVNFNKAFHCVTCAVTALLVFIPLALSQRSLAFAADPSDSLDVKVEDLSNIPSELHLGAELDRCFQIESPSAESFIRISIVLSDGTDVIADAYATPHEQHWTKGKDNKWYFKEPLSRGSAATFSTTMSLTGKSLHASQSKSAAHTSLIETVTAEAVQTEAVTPDWNSEFPWGIPDSSPDIKNDTIVNGDGHENDPDNPQGGSLTDNRHEDPDGFQGTNDHPGWIQDPDITKRFVGTDGSVQDASGIQRSEGVGKNPLPKTGDDALMEAVAIISAILIAFLLVVDICYHRFKTKQERTFQGIERKNL